MACVQKTSPSILALPGWDDASHSSALSAGVTLQGGRAKEEGSTGWRADIPDAYSLLTSPRANPRIASFPLTQVQWPMGTNETVDAGAFEKLP